MYKISIITINYNQREGLEKTIESVLNQTYQDFEFIIIDGGSTDGSKQVIEKFQDKIDYWVSEPDKGVYNAMNKGILAATGQYLLFLNSADWLYDANVLAAVEKNIDGSKGIYFGNAVFKFENKDKVVNYNNRISFEFFYQGNFCHQATFIKKNLFKDVFYYNEKLKIVSDWEFFICAICLKNVSHQYIDIIVSNYDLQGISSKPEFEEFKQEERQYVLHKYFSMFIEDYEFINERNSKRVQNIFYIKKFPFAWKILKAILNIFLLFLPKQKML